LSRQRVPGRLRRVRPGPMSPNCCVNVLLLAVLLARGVWWIHEARRRREALASHDPTNSSVAPLLPAQPLREVPEPLREADVEEARRISGSALARCNATVLSALLGDAISRGVQHRYLESGFVAPGRALDRDGLALQDLASTLHVVPAAIAEAGDAVAEAADSHWTGILDSEVGHAGALRGAQEVGRGTNYGEQLLMALEFLFPDGRRLETLEFAAFQRAWHRWQLDVRSEHRGKAAAIALKNLERGLTGRHAATLVADIGAVPRLPGLVAAFALDACQALLNASRGVRAEGRPLIEAIEDRLGRAARDITMATHDRVEALVAAEFLARVSFRLAFREVLLLPSPEGRHHALDRPVLPSLLWRAVDAVQRRMSVPFLRRMVRDAERLCARQLRRAPLGGELGGAQRLDPSGDRTDLGDHHTRQLPTPQSEERKRRLFGLSGGISAALPAALYLAWKYERHVPAALTANMLLGGNAAGRGIVVGMLLGARAGSAAVPSAWFAQLQSARAASRALASSSLQRVTTLPAPPLSYLPCPPALCSADAEASDVVTSADVRVVAEVAPAAGQGQGREAQRRDLLVQLNLTNVGASGLPICLYGKLWILWEAGGVARGRFRDLGDVADIADRCLRPREAASFAVGVSSSEPDALRHGPQHLVGLVEVVRPLRSAALRQRLRHPGAGNLIHAAVSHGRPEEDCEHFAAKIGRFRIPTPE